MSDNPEKKQEEQSSEKEKTPVQKEPVKAQEKPKEKKQDSKNDKESDDFQYIVRLSNTDVDGDKSLINGLTSIKGIGRHLSSLVIDNSGLDRSMKVGNLSEKQIEILQNAINDIEKKAPSWLLNHRKEYESGKDKHLIGPQIDMSLRDEINIMRKIRCYRGIRHETGLPCRGQRTRANNRKGLSLGVSKKRN